MTTNLKLYYHNVARTFLQSIKWAYSLHDNTQHIFKGEGNTVYCDIGFNNHIKKKK